MSRFSVLATRVVRAGLFAVSLVTTPCISTAQDSTATMPATARAALDSCAVLMSVAKYVDTESGPQPAIICGSGIVVARSGRVLTNMHVARPLFVEPDRLSSTESFGEGAQMASRTESFPPAGWKSDSRRADVSALEVDIRATPGISRFRAIADVREGEPLHTLGNRLCQGWIYSSGKVFRVIDPARDRDPEIEADELKQINALIRGVGAGAPDERYDQLLLTTRGFLDHGNSGGPVVDSDGRLVGMALGSVEGYGVVIPLKPLMKALNRTEPKTSSPTEGEPAPTPEPTPAKSAEELAREEAEIRAIFERMELTPGKNPD